MFRSFLYHFVTFKVELKQGQSGIEMWNIQLVLGEDVCRKTFNLEIVSIIGHQRLEKMNQRNFKYFKPDGPTHTHLNSSAPKCTHSSAQNPLRSQKYRKMKRLGQIRTKRNPKRIELPP